MKSSSRWLPSGLGIRLRKFGYAVASSVDMTMEINEQIHGVHKKTPASFETGVLFA